jgi:hypothetical protein
MPVIGTSADTTSLDTISCLYGWRVPETSQYEKSTSCNAGSVKDAFAKKCIAPTW